MEFSISNFRSIESAETADARLICVAGPNQSGKTSTLNAISAALRGDKKVYGATVADSSSVIADGHSAASCQVAFSNGAASSISWPGDAFTSGAVPPVNEITMGLVDPAGSYDGKKWAEFIRSIMDTPTKITLSMLEKRLRNMPQQNDKFVKEALDAAKGGLDAAAAFCTSEARVAKRMWAEQAGTSYGEKKADEMAAQPHGETAEELQKQIDELAAWHESARAAEKFGGESAEALTKRIEILGNDLEKQRRLEMLALKKCEDINASIYKLPAPVGESLTCPCCSSVVFLKGGALIDGGPDADDEENKAKRLELEGELNKASQDKTDAHFAARATQASLASHKELLAAFQSLGSKDMDPDGRSSDELSSVLEALRSEHRQRVRLMSANEHHARVQFFLGAASLFGPTGIRLDLMSESLPDLQAYIDDIAYFLFPGHEVKLRVNGSEIGLTFDGRPYKQLTWNGDPNSYALRIQYLFQIVQAQRLHPDAPVILDRIDTLEVVLRAQVIRCLIDNNIVAVIGRMMPSKPENDILKKAGAGLTYWINTDTKTLEAV